MKYARYRPKRDPDKKPKAPERPTTTEGKRVLAKAEAAYRAAQVLGSFRACRLSTADVRS